MYMCVSVCVCVCVYLGIISSLILTLFNNIDFHCLYIFVYTLSTHHIDFMVSDGNWSMSIP